MTLSNKPNSAWQFSIREFLLVVVAVGSLIVLYTSQRTFAPTAFSKSFDPNLLFGAAMKNLGVEANGGAGGGGSSGSRRVSMSYRSSYDKVEGTTQSLVLQEICKIVEQQIVDSGCDFRGGRTDYAEGESLQGFEIEYMHPNANGQIRVRSTVGERGDWQFWIDIFEY